MRKFRTWLQALAMSIVLPTASALAAAATEIPLDTWLKCSMDDGSSWRANVSETGGGFDDGSKTWRADGMSGSPYELNAERTHVYANPQYKYRVLMFADDGIRIEISSLNPSHSAKGVCLPENHDE